MITLLVLDDEQKICRLLSEALQKEGYSFIDEPQSRGIIKIVKKGEVQNSPLGKRILELQSLLLKTDEGHIYRAVVEEIEKPLIEAVLERVEGNQLKAAKMLGINRNTLRAKIKKLEINKR